MKTLNLNSLWRLRAEDLALNHQNQAAVAQKQEGWMDVGLPCDVRLPLLAAGAIPEPLEGLGCFESEWIENKSWWFVRDFVFDATDLAGESSAVRRVELVLDYLDFGADIYLNGSYLGEHNSVFYPFRQDVGRLLVAGANRLVVRLTGGADRVSAEQLGDFQFAVSLEKNNGRPDRGEARRTFLRKPQYAFGWDWGPRVATVGIGEARLELSSAVEVVELAVVALTADETNASLQVKFEIDSLESLSTTEAEYEIELRDSDGQVVHRSRKAVLLRAGANPITETIALVNPRLWWPSGWGDQSLHVATVRCSLNALGTVSEVTERFGIRTVEVDQSPLPELGPGHRKFAFRINGVEIFCKGANWIPADSLYERVDTAKYRALVDEARQANFSMLRVWGGGLYEKDAFYEACDEAGILVWQDLMFGCAFYPDRNDDFVALVEKELAYQLPRLGKRPCLALWCGNNEIHWAKDTRWYANLEPYFGGERIWNRVAPRMVASLCPTVPYWNSSPFGGTHPNGELAGDRHHWREAMMHESMEMRITPEVYDGELGKFVSEYGYIGPCSRRTIERYFAGEPPVVGSKVWNHHNNAFEKDTVAAGIAKHYLNPADLGLDDYLLYAGLVQSLVYGYSLESMRFRSTIGGGLFWMFADCWGEVGWTIIDYYLDRKPAFYGVRRAFSPQKLILRSKEGTVTCVGVNESAQPAKLEIEFGVVALDGASRRTERRLVELLPRFRGVLFTFAEPAYDPTTELVFVAPVEPGATLRPAALRGAVFRSVKTVDPRLVSKPVARDKMTATFEVLSHAWAHAVHFNLPEGAVADDEWFDLLPGEKRLVSVLCREASLAATLSLAPKSVLAP